MLHKNYSNAHKLQYIIWVRDTVLKMVKQIKEIKHCLD